MKQNNIKLYNVIFPIWMLLLIPYTWLIVLPSNFIIDLVVIVITMKALKLDNIKVNIKKTIFKVWIFGFLSDIIGALLMLFPCLIVNDNDWWYQNVIKSVMNNPFSSIWGLLWVIGSILFSSVCIYLFNYKISFKTLDITDLQKKKLSLSLAIITSPYLFLLS